MKKLLFIILNLLAFSSFAQDILMKREGEEIKCKILEITPEMVKYVKDTTSFIPIYSIYIKDVLFIKFENGSKEFFDENKRNDLSGVHAMKNNLLSQFIDARDSRQYKTVLIGDQWWMAENLQFQSGSSVCYDVKDGLYGKCGQFYHFEDALKACPEGWHLPTDNDWKKLEVTVGMSYADAEKKGWRGTHPGQAPKLLQRGGSKFELLFCGKIDDKFGSSSLKSNAHYSNNYIFHQAFYWTATQKTKSKVWIRHFNIRLSINRTLAFKNEMLPIRCVKND